MKLSRLYSNRPKEFAPIEFRDGFSAVLAEIRLPENQDLDTHNLGKSTIGHLLDFCLLKGRSKDFFLFQHATRFEPFAFFLELSMPDGSFLTIGRPVDPGSKISFLRTEKSTGDAWKLADEDWDHHDLAFARAKMLLDGELGIDALKPWDYRKLVGYLIRSQQDYLDVFQLGKFSGKHQEWKPFVAHLLGMDAELAIELYEKRAQLDDATERLASSLDDLGGEEADPSVLDGLIAVKTQEIEARQSVLDSFNFRTDDHQTTESLVEETETQIRALNEESYRLAQVIKQLEESLQAGNVLFKPNDAAALFKDAGVFFEDQLVKDFQQLIRFNKAITDERRSALTAQLDEARGRDTLVDKELVRLNADRAKALEYLRESDSFAKYKRLSKSVGVERSELATLEAKRQAAGRIVELRQLKRSLGEEYGHLQTSAEEQLEELNQDAGSQFGKIRQYFAEIVDKVVGAKAILSMSLNSQGGIEFGATFVGETGIATSGDRGTTYKKLLCIAFDLAVLRVHSDDRFPRFVYHDGALEQLERRKKERLLEVFREYADFGLQPVISALDSDLPKPLDSDSGTLASEEIILKLHDEGDAGRLFKMPAW